MPCNRLFLLIWFYRLLYKPCHCKQHKLKRLFAAQTIGKETELHLVVSQSKLLTTRCSSVSWFSCFTSIFSPPRPAPTYWPCVEGSCQQFLPYQSSSTAPLTEDFLLT